MELRIEDVKTNLIRLQGQMDTWSSILRVLEQEEAKKTEEAKNASPAKS